MRRRVRKWREICSVRPKRAFRLIAIFVYCSVRDGTCSLRHRIRKYPCTRYRIRCGHIFFFTLESGFIFFRIRCRIRRIRVDGSRFQKEKVSDSKISGYVLTGPERHRHARTASCLVFLPTDFRGKE